ncbi:hypothetical protein [uncultured Clostridium sp.]|nr:hypothetical protein [uncultured Clostridium sp.]MDU1348689.1 hypothetical protein [Clostridium argentinense]
MKKFCGWILLLIFSISIFVFTIMSKYDYGIQCKESNVNLEIKYKGFTNSRDFDKDEKGNYYIAFKDRVIIVEENGKSYNLFSKNSLNITNIQYDKEKIYYVSDSSLFSYDLKTKDHIECVKGIPNIGDYNKILLKLRGDYLFIAIGAATNSGVVGEDNTWKKNYPTEHDYSPNDIILKGNNFGEKNTGAFTEYGKSNLAGHIIEKSEIGNSTVVIYNIGTKAYETFAWGIRNIMGMDFSSEGKLIATVGGMEERGLRPISNDSDYIYEIQKGIWYGFPDFSGGDPINSLRFLNEDNKGQEFILESHPTENPPGPLYQHNKVSALGSIAVDSQGKLGDMDTMYFYDSVDKKIYSYNKLRTPKEYMDFGQKAQIESIKIFDDKLNILESNKGILYELKTCENKSNIISLNLLFKYLIFIALTLIISIIILFI